HFLDGAVEKLGLFGLGGPVVDLLAAAAADDQPAALELAQMVRHGGAAHADYRRDIDDALLTVAQQPEDSGAAGVAELLEQLGYRFEVLLKRHRLRLPLDVLSVVVRQLDTAH